MKDCFLGDGLALDVAKARQMTRRTPSLPVLLIAIVKDMLVA